MEDYGRESGMDESRIYCNAYDAIFFLKESEKDIYFHNGILFALEIESNKENICSKKMEEFFSKMKTLRSFN